MKWIKASEEVINKFESIIPEIPGIEKRKMFGYPVTFINGNMFMGVHGNSIILRLSNDSRVEFLKLESAKLFEPMPGRYMKEYVVIPEWMFDNKPILYSWIDRSFEYTSGLPIKLKK
ncbi:MAG: TfoX/Sxy family protein [Actinobacteria bacterium]|nr:TfoX/Sxy family protein [Actinomycetota bacterium]MBM3713720.1 TfoX/Sxy family protein [Actinomycetota bacterium]